MYAPASVSAFSDLVATCRWPWGLFHPERWSLPVSDWQPDIHRGTDLEWPQRLFPHYFDSELLQIEDSAVPGLGNFLAPCNVLSLNWFFRDDYLRPSGCSCRQAEKGSWHIFTFRHVLGLISPLTWPHKHGKGKAGQNAKLLLTPEPGSSNANFLCKKHASSPSVLFRILPSCILILNLRDGHYDFRFSTKKTEDHWAEIQFPR